MKRSKDQGLSRVKKALDNKENPLSICEIEFIRTSCRILNINSEDVIKRIVKKALEKGGGQAKRVMASLRAQLDDLGNKGRSTRGRLQPRLSPRGPMTTWMHRRAAWLTCKAV